MQEEGGIFSRGESSCGTFQNNNEAKSNLKKILHAFSQRFLGLGIYDELPIHLFDWVGLLDRPTRRLQIEYNDDVTTMSPQVVLDFSYEIGNGFCMRNTLQGRAGYWNKKGDCHAGYGPMKSDFEGESDEGPAVSLKARLFIHWGLL